MSGRDALRRGIDDFLDEYGERAAEVIWLAALGWLDRATTEARAGLENRWRHYPAGELKRLRAEIAGALSLARLALAIADDESEQERQLYAEARAAAEDQRRRVKREMTTEAQRARLNGSRRR